MTKMLSAGILGRKGRWAYYRVSTVHTRLCVNSNSVLYVCCAIVYMDTRVTVYASV